MEEQVLEQLKKKKKGLIEITSVEQKQKVHIILIHMYIAQ